MPVLTVGAVDNFRHLRKRHGSYIGVELHQFVAVSLGKNIRVQRHDLPEFNIGRTQFLQNDPEFLRSHSSRDLIAEKDLADLLHPRPVVHLCLVFHKLQILPFPVSVSAACVFSSTVSELPFAVLDFPLQFLNSPQRFLNVPLRFLNVPLRFLKKENKRKRPPRDQASMAGPQRASSDYSMIKQ